MSAFVDRLRADGGWIGLVLLFYALLLALVPPRGEFPTADDFDYAATAWHLADHGRLTLSDWPAMTLVTHVAWGALACKLFGNSFAVLRCAECLLSAIAAVSIYCGFRRWGHTRPLAALAATCFAVNPLTVSLEYTFMTDMTGAALSAVLIAWAPQPSRASTRQLAIYSVVGGLAYLARETACIPWIILLLTTGWNVTHRRAAGRTLFSLGGPAGLMIGLYQYWIREFTVLPFNRSQPSLNLAALVSDPQRPLFLVTGLALALAPLGLVAMARLSGRRASRAWLLPLACSAVVMLLVCLGVNVAPPYRTELFDLGLRPPESPIDRIPSALAGPFVNLLGREVSIVRLLTTTIAWSLAAAFGLLFATRRADRAASTAAPAKTIPIATLTFLATAALYMLTLGLVDRYLLSLAPAALLMLAEQLPPRFETRSGLWLGWAGALCVAVGSLIGIQDAMVRSRVFFAAAESLQQRGVDPFDIDAGLAFGGMYRFNPTYRGASNRGPFWSTVPEHERSTVIASIQPLSTTLDRPYRISFDNEPGYTTIDEVRYTTWLRSGTVQILGRVTPN